MQIRPFFITYWTATSFLTSLHAIGLFSVLKDRVLRFRPLEFLGKASYHIFLTQMVFFNGVPLLEGIITSRPLRYLVCITVCLLAGVLFYVVEQPLNRLCVRAFTGKVYKSSSAMPE